MKLLGIVCSPRKNSNTEILVQEALDQAAKLGAEIEIINAAKMEIKPCDACDSCHNTTSCHIQDEMQQVYPKLLAADGIIIGSPVYYWGITAQAKALIDRTYVFRRHRDLRNKVSGAVVVAGQVGNSTAFSALNEFFNLHRLIPARSIGSRTEEELRMERPGGVTAYAYDRGQVRDNLKAMDQARGLGQSMVETVDALRRE